MSPDLLTQFTEVFQTAGALGAIVFFGFGFVKRWWVLGWTYDELRHRYDADCDQLRSDAVRWRDLFLSNFQMTEEAVDHLTNRTPR